MKKKYENMTQLQHKIGFSDNKEKYFKIKKIEVFKYIVFVVLTQVSICLLGKPKAIHLQ